MNVQAVWDCLRPGKYSLVRLHQDVDFEEIAGQSLELPEWSVDDL